MIRITKTTTSIPKFLLDAKICNEDYCPAVKKIIKELIKCDDLHNRCDYLLEHDEITYLTEYIKDMQNKLSKAKEDITFCINGMKNEYACTDSRTNRELHTMVKILEETLNELNGDNNERK